MGLGVDPVEILKDDEERLDLALPEQETLHGVQRSVVALRGLERLPPRILHRHVQEREEGRDSRLEGGSSVSTLPVSFSRTFRASSRGSIWQ